MPIPFSLLHPGLLVQTAHGTIRQIALVHPDGTVWAHGPQGLERILPLCEAWGGEMDATEGTGITLRPQAAA